MKTTKTATATAAQMEQPIPSETATQPAIIQPDLDAVRVRAYLIWERRMTMGLHGSPENDWNEALVELTNEGGQGQ